MAARSYHGIARESVYTAQIVSKKVDWVTLTTPIPIETGKFEISIPDGWQQGKGAFGGLVLSILARAATACEADSERKLRSLHGEIPLPVLPGAATIHVETVRRGKGVSNVIAKLSQNGEVAAFATVIFASARGADTYLGLTPPQPTHWSKLTPLPIGPPLGPVFTPHFEFRSDGPLPFSGSTDANMHGWIRLRETPAVVDSPTLIALADAWWPAAVALDQSPRPYATIEFTFHTGSCGLVKPDLPLFYRSRVVSGNEGYFVEHRELWTEGGELVALNPQTFVRIR